MTPSYTLIRSSRRTLSIQIDASGSLIVRSPMRLSIARIEEFLSAKTIWIANHQNARKQQYQLAKKLVYTKEQIQEMQQALSRYIVPRVYELWE